MVDRIGLLISDNYGDYRVAPVSAPYVRARMIVWAIWEYG